ncbi:MAG: MBL fold metallo-hydrolase [Clostridia bacterium]|nr:MBL fold metallo-hydrolase [Clostridia bacterium]
MAQKTVKDSSEKIIEPFRLFGNVYFIGTYAESSHIIDTGEGLIMIDTGRDNLGAILKGLETFGYSARDVKYIINSHWHGDHTASTREMAEMSGAKTLIGKDDYEKAKRYFDADILVSEGDTLTLGNTTVTFMGTPGHTKGTISLFFDSEDNGQVCRVGMFGGAGANTLAKGKFDYEGCREDYRKSVHRLLGEKVDVFIGNHSWNNMTYENSLILRETGENRFIDPTAWTKFLESCERKLDETIAKDAF